MTVAEFSFSLLPQSMQQMSPTEVGTWAAATASLLTIILQVINILNTNYKEERTRKWRLEDEDRAQKLAAKLEADKEELARQTRHSIRDTNQAITSRFDETAELLEDVKREAAERLKEIREMHEKTQAKIDENTEISKVAFKEANGVNEKLLNIKQELLSQPKEVVVVNDNSIPVHETQKS